MFDFVFFQGEKLMREYKDLLYEDDFFITNDISYNHKEKKLYRQTDEYTFLIDLKNNNMHLKLINQNYEGDVILSKANVQDNKRIITITYQLDDNEPVYKIVITRRKNEG